VPINTTAILVFALIFAGVTILGFAAAKWRPGNLKMLDEWGLGGRQFGTFVTWFLLGGDIYTAYSFIALPAIVFGAGAIGFFALPYTIICYPLMFLLVPRLWAIARANDYVTAGDFVLGWYGDRWLMLAVAITGIVATMPFIALQLVGIEVVIGAMGLTSTGILGELPLIIAFVILAAFTYTSGLRAPASIAIVKDVLIYITVLTAVIVIPAQLGGFEAIFKAVPQAKLTLSPPTEESYGAYSAYASLALGSAIALFLYPHVLTGSLSAKSVQTLRRNAALLPAYSLLLGLLALMGFMAIASGVDKLPAFATMFKQYGANFAVPALLIYYFPSWFVGLAFAAIAIGALVPAAIMSIAAANLFSRNVYQPFIKRDACSAERETQIAKITSLVIKLGALGFILVLPAKFAIELQLLAGVWISQTFPALIFGLFTRWFNSKALLIGWAAGIIAGTLMVGTMGFQTAVYPLVLFGVKIPGFAALYALALNIAIGVVLSLVMRKSPAHRGWLLERRKPSPRP
jgi:SSS family solute:Na+ symporter